MNHDFLVSKGATAICNVLNISRQTANNYIKGLSCMSADQALRLARHYGVSLATVIDADYQEVKAKDLLLALDKENRMLIHTIDALRSRINSLNNEVDDLIFTIMGDENE